MKKRAVVAVTNDLNGDARVDRTCNALLEAGFEVMLTGRKKRNSSDQQQRDYSQKRFNLWAERGFLFYSFFNIRLFWFLMLNKEDLIVSNDLDTLPACWLASTIKRKKLIFDTHEYFTGVPELVNRAFVRKCWKRIENFLFPRLKEIITVNNSIAALYQNEYQKEIAVIRNIPHIQKSNEEVTKKDLGISETARVILYQGAINKDRGLEEMIDALPHIKTECILLIVGNGDVLDSLQEKVSQLSLKHKVVFTGFVPLEKLSTYTKLADIGISLEKDNNINYRLCLPNKFFSYIHFQKPVLISRLPEMENIMNEYEVGCFIENHSPQHIAEKIDSMFSNEAGMKLWKINCSKATAALNWQNEKIKLLQILKKYA